MPTSHRTQEIQQSGNFPSLHKRTYFFSTHQILRSIFHLKDLPWNENSHLSTKMDNRPSPALLWKVSFSTEKQLPSQERNSRWVWAKHTCTTLAQLKMRTVGKRHRSSPVLPQCHIPFWVFIPPPPPPAKWKKDCNKQGVSLKSAPHLELVISCRAPIHPQGMERFWC